MRNEKEYLRNLMQELPTEKAPEGITSLIMQQIKEQEAKTISLNTTRIWQTQAFYILLSLIATEAYLLWSYRGWFTLENIIGIFRNIYIQICQYFALNSYSPLFMGAALVGVTVYLFVRERIESERCCVGMHF